MSATRRLSRLLPHIRPTSPLGLLRHASTVRIGEVSATLSEPALPELVPRPSEARGAPWVDSPEVLDALAWLMKKSQLRQDVYLLGAPGPQLRQLAFRFCEVLDREAEYVAISRDTTESDLKQRREIRGGSVVYSDQPVVQAALHGRVLVLEGLEKAERNLLPILNNLLENREMALEDGAFLMHPERFDALVADGMSESELARRRLLRVSPDFMVVALGLQVPRFPGAPLDPPLRSRFQAAAP